MRLTRSITTIFCLLVGMVSLHLWIGSAAQGPAVDVTIEVAANRHSINSNIYGVAFAK